MHKHRRKQKGTTDRQWRNANVRITPAVAEYARSIRIGASGNFSSDYLDESYLSKFCSEDLVSASHRRDAAIRKWIEVENRNADTNRRLRGTDMGYNILPRVTFRSFLKFAQRLMKEILGDLTNEVVLGSFSGGASTSRKRTESLPAHKYVGMADITASAAPYVDLIHREAPLLRESGIFYSLREVEGAVLFTVPKKTDIDRCACKEPDINMFLQKGVGKHIRSRLRRFGINLNDQSINRKLAHRGSLLGDLATLDLSSASDTVTTSCVLALLPHDWFLYLNDIRSHSVVIDGTVFQTEMFSSMGNGFTFELESLIFYVLMRTTSYFEGISGIISVYGDDLIIPSGLYDSATWILSEFGFVVNPDKSFSTGPFRESCGGHYHLGVDVTPFYLKREATHITDIIRIANQLRRWVFAEASRQYEFPQVQEIWNTLASFVPRDLWGGRDYALDTQLVSPHAPCNRLVRITRKPQVPEVGAYMHWHGSNWNRSIEPKVGFEPTTTDTLCRRRRATPGAPFLPEQFFEELTQEAGIR